MSYLNNVTVEEKALLNEITSGVRDYYDNEMPSHFKVLNNIDLSEFQTEIKNKIFCGNCDFSGNYKTSITFKNCFFLKTVSFYDVIFTGKLEFDHCFFDKGIKFLKDVGIGQFNIIVASIKGQLQVDDCKIQESKWSIIDNCRILINGGQFGNLHIGYWGGSVLKELSFNFTKITGTISITGDQTRIERLDLIQYSSDLSLTIENIAVNSVSIYRYRNEKLLRFSNLSTFEIDEKSSEFSIVESNLGNAEFYSINFRLFKALNIVDAFLVNCIFVNVTFPKNIFSLKGRYVYKNKEEEKSAINMLAFENNNWFLRQKKGIYSDTTTKAYFQKKKETLRQIKFALNKQGDVVNEKKFHSLEMKAYDRSLSWNTSFWTKLIINFSSWTSDFGQSILRPISLILIGHFILFYILLFNDQLLPIHISFHNPTSDGFWDSFHKYFILISPFRKTDDTFGGGFILVDLAMRIWSSYMIYNIIRASRRFIK